VYTCPVQDRIGKVGIVTGKRLGNAVERNRIRRSIRETIRTNQHQVKANRDLIVVARPPALQLPRRELTGQLLGLLRKSEALDT
jgi:ribonuclease P protein component